MVAGGDKVVIRNTLRGTHKGDLMGTARTGKRIEVTGTDIMRFENGKIVEHWGTFDGLVMMQQIGAILASAPRG